MLEELRKDAGCIQPDRLIRRTCDADFSRTFNETVNGYHKRGRLRLGILYVHRIMEALEQQGIEMSAVDTYCQQEFGRPLHFRHCMLEVMAYVFRLDIGVWWAPGEVSRRCPSLEFDNRGLLMGPQRGITFEKDGVRHHGRHVVPYHPEMDPYNLGLSGGFLETLIQFAGGAAPTRFGLRIAEDMVLDPSRHGLYMTKAYIRGPKGISKKMLQSPQFPEDPRGTVTTHQRVDDDSLEALLFPLHRTEVMWSARDGTKTVKIEELVPSVNELDKDATVSNRYVHAIWDPSEECFVHFDGAVRVYKGAEYQLRLEADMKKTDATTCDYIKLFRIDGKIPVEVWSDLTTRFFYQNELVLEYLGGPIE